MSFGIDTDQLVEDLAKARHQRIHDLEQMLRTMTLSVAITPEAAKLREELAQLRLKVANNEPECCGEYGNCMTACVERADGEM